MYTGDETDLDADRPQSNLCEKEKIMQKDIHLAAY